MRNNLSKLYIYRKHKRLMHQFPYPYIFLPKSWSKTTPIPLLGDQSLGVRVGDRRHDIAVDHLWVSSGHNLLHVSMVTGYREDNEDLLERAAEGVLDRLER